MAQDFGNGVSRSLSAKGRQFQMVVWQANKPPLDSELNLVAQVDWERQAEETRSSMHSGFLLDPMQSDKDFQTNPNWSNWFKFGRPDPASNGNILYANVNGWILPVVGTGLLDGDEANRINLIPPSDTDNRIDFVFLEVWQAQVAPNPSTQNKPSASSLWKFGNVEFGGTNIVDDIEDPTIGFETTERVQLQYRIRVVGHGAGFGISVNLSQYPDGLDDPQVLARGANGSNTSFNFVNMKDELGDPGLWRAGDGNSSNDLNTVDGYSYAIPICAVFRRSSSAFVARTNSGNATQMGGLNRNPVNIPVGNPIDGTRTLSSVTLTADLSPSTFGVVSVTGLSGSGLDNSLINWDGSGVGSIIFLMIDEEIIAIDSVDAGAGTITISNPATRQGRGRWGTQDTFHSAGSEIKIFNFRPDNKFSDEITASDILDLRRGVTKGEWDYEALLKHNLDKLLRGDLKSAYKEGNGTDTQGVKFIEVDTMIGNGAGVLPNQTERVDGFDGIRTHFSDSVVVQKGVTVLLAPEVGASATPIVINDFTTNSGNWEVGADFAVSGLQPTGGGFVPGTILDFWIGGVDGNSGARATTGLSNNRFMRFVSPAEEYEQTFVEGVRTLNLKSLTNTVNLQFPWSSGNVPADLPNSLPWFNQYNYGPVFCDTVSGLQGFIFLGGVANDNLKSGVAQLFTGSSPDGLDEIQIPGLDFTILGDWYLLNHADQDAIDTEGINNLLLYGRRNLFDVLTKGGTDLSGNNSELYVVVRDTANPENCGVWVVLGAGTSTNSFTYNAASAVDRIVVQKHPTFSSAGAPVAATVDIECRTPYTNTEDGPTSSSLSSSSAVIVIGDLTTHGTYVADGIKDQMVVSLSVAYGPSRGGTARVPDKVRRVALVDAEPTSTLLREAGSALDPLFDNEAAVPENEVYLPMDQHIQTWSQLQTRGAYPPVPNLFDTTRYVSNMYREGELFIDEGSKTLVIRPYQKFSMTLFTQFKSDLAAGIPEFYDDGVTLVDGAGIKVPQDTTLSREAVYQIPYDYMPKFGRQDIPIRKATGNGNILFGINHLFCDQIGSLSNTSDVYKIIGGENNITGGVEPLYLTTEAATGRVYGDFGPIVGVSAYQGRLYEDLNGRSSDFQKRLRGIQLPPYIGVARIYGIYDARDWNATAGSSAFQTDRATLKTTGSRSTNLIRTDADKQTLWIIRDGAQDVISGSGNHTYMIPEEALDIKLSPNYTSGEEFVDLEYIVEMEVFIFSRGFINANNYIFPRRYDGDGQEYSAENPPVPATALNPSQLNSIDMILPAAVRRTVQGYVAYERTPYQGDPYMTRDGETLQPADYEQRYGQIPVTDSYQLGTPIQQFYPDNSQTPEHYNCRTLEVLATMDFWTTLGTGKISGPVLSGTGLDAGSVEVGRKLPSSETENPAQPVIRAFTEETKTRNPVVEILVTDWAAAKASFNVGFKFMGTTATIGTIKGANPTDMASNIAAAIQSGINAALGNPRAFVTSDSKRVTLFSELPSTEPISVSISTEGVNIIPVPNTTTSVPLYRNRISLESKGLPQNAAIDPYAITPARLTGCIERLPLGILMQDSDFIGEDPVRTGDVLVTKSGGIEPAKSLKFPLDPEGNEYGRIGSSGFIGMSEGGVLRYTPYRQGISDGGSKRFRIFRGGGSLYVLHPETPGGPVDFNVGGFNLESNPVVKGNVLAGRAYLVRNYQEEAFAGNVTRTYGGEIQMVIATYAITGAGPSCKHGYSLEGYLAPTGWGEGFAAADRYRLEGKPLYQPGSEIGPDCDVFIAPFPSEDPIDDPCA